MLTLTQSLKELSQIKLAAMAGTAVVLIGFFVFISLRISSPVMTPLYTNMSMADGGQIVQELEKNNIPYQLRANGTQLLVPSDKVLNLRLSMAQLGLPSSGSVIGYEVFDSSESLGTSNFVLNVNKLRALEGELSRTIGSFTKVDKARVHLVIPKRELFTRDKQEPTASIALKLRSSGLDKQEISAIRHLVSTAVPGLKVQRITIVDSRGRLLAKGVDSEDDLGVMAEEAEDFRIRYERRIRSTIERLVEQTLGIGKVKAEVNAQIDFDRIVKNSETYDPDGQVARSIQEVSESEVSNEKKGDATVSVGQNLPNANAKEAGTTAFTEAKRSEGTTNFEISKEIINQVSETGTVKRLSVAVLVDGIYELNEEGISTYQARGKKELDKLEDLIRAAVGFDAERGDNISVINMQFSNNEENLLEESPLDWLKNDLDGIIQTLVVGSVAILAILLVIRPLVNRAIESAELASQEDEFEQAALSMDSVAARLSDLSGEDEEDMINIDRIHGRVKSSSYRKINDLVDKHPEEALHILRSWNVD